MQRLRRVRNLVPAVAIAASALAGTGAVIGAQPAAASGSTQCASSGCDLFQFGPDNGYFFSTPGHTIVGMICWEDSVWYAGTNRWFKISTIYGTGRAWVSANQVINQTRVGHC
jgi:hypothetical protein